jgi:hypothetical protein
MFEHDYIPLGIDLIDGVHIRRIGMAIWLLMFLVKKQTSSDGLVNYGRPITYRWIFDLIPHSPPERTLRLWMAALRVNGYIAVERLPYGQGIRVRIINSRKWPKTQLGLFEANRALSKNRELDEENVRNCGNPIRQDLDALPGRILTPITLLKEKIYEKRKSEERGARAVQKEMRKLIESTKIS